MCFDTVYATTGHGVKTGNKHLPLIDFKAESVNHLNKLKTNIKTNKRTHLTIPTLLNLVLNANYEVNRKDRQTLKHK